MVDDANNAELTREQDVITPEEFDSLERRENKTSFVKKLFSKSKDDSSKSEDKKPQKKLSLESLTFEFENTSKKLDDLMVAVEMQGGKLDMEKELRSALNERIIDLSSQLGELRSTLISKERMFDQFEVDFASFQDVVTTINPKSIQENFDKKEIEMTKLDSKIEKNSSVLKSLQDQLSQFSSQMTKLGSFEDLFDILKKLDSKVKKVVSSKEKSEQILSKVESLFVELNSKTKLIDKLKDSLKELEASFSQQKKDLSVLQNKVSALVKKEDFESLKKDVDIMKKDTFDKDVLETGFKDLKSNSEKFGNILSKHNAHIKSHISKIDTLTLSNKELKEQVDNLKSLINKKGSKIAADNSFNLSKISTDIKEDIKEAKLILDKIRKERTLLVKEKSKSVIKIIPSPSPKTKNSILVVPDYIKPLVDFLSEASKMNKLDLNLEKQVLDKGWTKKHIALAKKYVN